MKLSFPCWALWLIVASSPAIGFLSQSKSSFLTVTQKNTKIYSHAAGVPPKLFSRNDVSPRKLMTMTTQLHESSEDNDNDGEMKLYANNGEFSLSTALFCGGFAFDAYSEPPESSSRWERGSSGVNVAFQSMAFTRSIYKGLLQIQPIKCTDLPDEDDTAEGLMTGGGTDGYVLVAVAEGKWKEDIQIIEKEKYNDGVLALQGCAHIGRSSTAWSNVNKNKAMSDYKKGKGSGAYHIKSSWGKGGQAIWDHDAPFYLYVQDPKDARLVFTVMDDDVVGNGSPIGSTSKRLRDILPAANIDDPIAYIKEEVAKKIRAGEEVDVNDTEALLSSISQEWDGSMKLTSKPKKRDKNGQIAAAAAAGAMVAGPLGAAVGGIAGSFYEGEPRGRLDVKVKYNPIPPVAMKGEKYQVNGGLEGVSWGSMYEKHIERVKETLPDDAPDPHMGGSDLEFCSFVTHTSTGCSCAIYRSLEKKLIAVSFRGTCELIDLVTDASIIQESWVEGEEDAPEKVHTGFRKSMASISRRLKELILASVAPGDDIADYDLIVTGHSLGGSLSTLFTADVGEYGIDAGRGLPQTDPSDKWWMSLASNFMSNVAPETQLSPPRPKSLRMYNFGSPRVGNAEFVAKFDSLIGNGIDEAYRIVNGQDVVARLPRTFNGGVVTVGYEHCGPTVLINIPEEAEDAQALVWIEGQSEGDCPVRDGTAMTSPLAKGSLLGDIVSGAQLQTDGESEGLGDSLSKLGSAMKDRFASFEASDIAGLVGIDKNFVERESNIIKSLVSGEALSHHMEDQYYMAMGRSSGFVAKVGEEIRPMILSESQQDEVSDLISEEADVV